MVNWGEWKSFTLFLREKMLQRKLAHIYKLALTNFEEEKIDEIIEKSSQEAYHAELAKKIFKFKIRENNNAKETIKILHEFFSR